MNNIKKYIIILSIILFITIIIFIILINSQIKDQEQEYVQQENIEMHKESIFTPINDYKTYYTIKAIINNYIVCMKQINGDEYVENGKINKTLDEIQQSLQEEGMSSLKGILDKQYMKETNDSTIKLEQDKYKQNGNYDKNVIYNLNIEELVEKQMNKNITIVLVNAQINDTDLKMIVKLDKLNNTYSLFLEDYIEKYNYNKEMNEEDININRELIDANNYNCHIKIDASETYIISQYFSEYRMKMINDTKNAYELLDEKYRQEKYGSYENFENYINNNEQDILYSSIKKYQVNEYDGIKEYVCIDENGKYYIFLESGITDYKVALDTYTTDLPQFLDKYIGSKDEIKSGLNIQKIFDAINDGDYSYVYKKLDETFRQNNFPTQESFDEYAKKYFLSNQLSYDNCEKSGELYIFDITVTEGTENNNQFVKKTFIIKLLEDTDFVFSFNVQ